MHVAIFPRYARDALDSSIRATFSSLARYAATILRPGTPEHVFHEMRRQMAGDIVKFDALRSYAVFEALADTAPTDQVSESCWSCSAPATWWRAARRPRSNSWRATW